MTRISPPRRGLSLLLTIACATAAWADSKPTENWTAKDTAGKAVAVPADHTSVLVFLRPDQPQSRTAIEQVNTLLKDNKDLQIIAVVSGDDAAANAAKLAAGNPPWVWPIVTDPQYAAAGKFKALVWPTTVIITKSGTQAAHIAGLPASYAGDLEAYVAFAAGKIDQSALEKRLAGREIVADSAEQKASRHVEVALRLAEKGLKDQARAELTKALSFQSTEPKLQTTLARALLIVGDAKSAETLIGQFKPGAVFPADVNLLRGWAALQLDRWDEALASLTEAVKLNPQPAEASYLLGLVYQHKGDSAKAGESFRKAFEHTPEGRLLAP